MTKYFATFDVDGSLINIGTVETLGDVHGEITFHEYEKLRNSPEGVVNE